MHRFTPLRRQRGGNLRGYLMKLRKTLHRFKVALEVVKEQETMANWPCGSICRQRR